MTNQQGAPEALRLAASLVTRESAMQAIGHVAIHNSYYREREAVEMLVAATPPTQAAPSVLEDAVLLKEARDALWQPANVALCERIDAYLDAARKQGANHD